jgi:hypothetical protein
MEKPTTQKIDGLWDLALAWAKKDFLVIVVCLVCLLACLLTLASVGSYQQHINDLWQQQWDSSGCMVKPYQPNITFNLRGDYEHEIEN